MSLRTQIAENLGLALQNITIANGYNSDLGNKVIYFYGPVSKGVEHIVYQDGDEDYTEENRHRQNSLALDIQVTRFGSNYGQLINDAVEDVLKAVLNDKSLGLTNVYVSPVSTSVDVGGVGQELVVITMRFKAKYLVFK